MQTAVSNLNDVVMCAINGIEAGDTKKEAAQSITSFVEANYIAKTMIQELRDITIADAEKLYSMGFEFTVNDGRIAEIKTNAERNASYEI